MTDTEVARWTKEHLHEFTQPRDDIRLATFRLRGELVTVPIPDELWRYCLIRYKRMEDLRRSVRARALRERRG
jgi:hypothetical protein